MILMLQISWQQLQWRAFLSFPVIHIPSFNERVHYPLQFLLCPLSQVYSLHVEGWHYRFFHIWFRSWKHWTIVRGNVCSRLCTWLRLSQTCKFCTYIWEFNLCKITINIKILSGKKKKTSITPTVIIVIVNTAFTPKSWLYPAMYRPLYMPLTASMTYPHYHPQLATQPDTHCTQSVVKEYYIFCAWCSFSLKKIRNSTSFINMIRAGE
jgi:hypothetical protein